MQKKAIEIAKVRLFFAFVMLSRVCLTISTTPHLSVIASTSDQTKRFGCNGSTNTANIAVAII